MKTEIIITRALANGPRTLTQITEGRLGEKAAIKRKVGYMVKHGHLSKLPGKSAHKSLYALPGQTACKLTHRRGAGDLLVPRGAPNDAVAFIPAITADKSLLLLRGTERIRLTPEQTLEVADLVLANFEQD